jgi:hypothetical protein
MLCVLRIVIYGLSRLIPIIIHVFKRLLVQIMHNLTVKIIVGAIKRELAEDMTLTIKTICALLRVKLLGVNPSYSKIWRGHEEAITHFFEAGSVCMVYYLNYSMSFNQ